MSDRNGFNFSPLALCTILGVLVLSLSACATQRYGRMTPVSPGERASLDCGQIALEIEKANFFIADIQRQRSETTGAHVLGALGDFGIGNVMEGDAAEKSGTNRLHELKVLQGGKSCASMESAESADSWATLPDGSVQMTGGEIEALVVGNSWIYFSGRGGVYFNPDGSAATEWKGKREPGRWYIENDEVCIDVESWGKDWCYKFFNLDGDALTYYTTMSKYVKVPFEPGNKF